MTKSATETTQSEESVVVEQEQNVAEIAEVTLEAKVEPVTEVVAHEVAQKCVAVSVVPQDSALRRHYLQNLAGNKENAGEQVPEDSALRRHYLQNLAAQESCVEAIAASVNANAAVRIPEDVVLRRHFTQQLFAEVAATMVDRPTDATLKRHYDAQLSSAVADRLEALK
ncbi:MAG: hypothetical protein RQ733_06295 [Methyloprofundus sp.]|nr:hypothetical protein [Methyloprofundus sp.]